MARLSSSLAILAVLCAVLLTSEAANTPLALCTRGRVTGYDVDTDGACGFGSYRTIYTMAPNTAFFNNSNVCGTCFEVTGPSGTEIFMAADECPVASNSQYCSGDVIHFDLNAQAFPSIAPTSVGVSFTQIREIVCPANGNIAVIVGAVGNSYYLPIYVFNHRVPIAGVQVKDAGSNTAYTTLTRENYNAWQWTPSNAIVYPVTYLITSVYGETITNTIPTAPTTTNQKIDGTTQFTVWPTTVTENACPTFYEYNIFVNGLNDGGSRTASELWQTTSSANVAYTANVPSGATVAAQSDIAGYGEWYFLTRGTNIPSDTIESVELWAYSPTSTAAMQLSWNDCCTNAVNFGSVTSTWTKFTFPKAQFGSSLAALGALRIKNSGSTAVSGFTIANFRINPTSSVVVTPTSSAATPAASTNPPTATSTPPTATSTPPTTTSTPTSTSTPPTAVSTPAVTPVDASNPDSALPPSVATPTPGSSASALHFGFGFFAIIALALALIH